MNKKAFIGLSVVIDLIILIIIITAAVEMNKSKKESSSSSADRVLEESQAESSSSKNADESTPIPTETPAAPINTQAEPSPVPTQAPTQVPQSAGGNMTVSVRYDGMPAEANAVTGIMDITNNGSPVSLSDLKIDFYLTKNGKTLVFENYHSAINTVSGSYQALNSVSGSFSDTKGTDADTLMTISFGDAQTLGTGDKLTVNFCAHSSDWTMMTTTDDWSVKDPGNIVIRTSSGVICGKSPE